MKEKKFYSTKTTKIEKNLGAFPQVPFGSILKIIILIRSLRKTEYLIIFNLKTIDLKVKRHGRIFIQISRIKPGRLSKFNDRLYQVYTSPFIMIWSTPFVYNIMAIFVITVSVWYSVKFFKNHKSKDVIIKEYLVYL